MLSHLCKRSIHQTAFEPKGRGGRCPYPSYQYPPRQACGPRATFLHRSWLSTTLPARLCGRAWEGLHAFPGREKRSILLFLAYKEDIFEG
eukprot:6031235-Amphidinium_carterae.1